MAVLVTDCPHCGAKQMTFKIFGVVPVTAERARAQSGLCTASIAASCEKCGDPISAVVISAQAKDSYPNFPHRAMKLLSEAGTPRDFNFDVMDTWPKVEGPSVPEHLPAAVERPFMQGEKNYVMEGCEDASALMYRSALEQAMKHLQPDAKGPLAKRIDLAVEGGLLPKSIGEWAHEVRIVGNESAHDLEGVSRDDLKAARGFVDATLRYLFSLPKMVADRREKRQDREFIG
jgi:hypothetical protein